MLALSKDGGDIVNSIIIKKNSLTGVPYGRQYNFKGEKLEVYVLQGELTSPYECTLLYKYIVTGMDKNVKAVGVHSTSRLLSILRAVWQARA